MNILRHSFIRISPSVNVKITPLATSLRFQSTATVFSSSPLQSSNETKQQIPVNLRKVYPPRRKAKRSKSAANKINRLSLEDAITTLKSVESAKPRTLELYLSSALPSGLNKNAFRGSLSLPYSFDKVNNQEEIVVVFSSKEQVDAIKEEGIEHAGPTADLFPKILDGTIKPHKVYSTPEEISHLTRNIDLVKLLGKKGLVPSTRRGTVVDPSGIRAALAESRKHFHWKGDERGCVRLPSGRLDQSNEQLIANVQAICGSIGSLIVNHSGSSKNIRKVCISATQMPSYAILSKDWWRFK